jgi:hypothetical protein
LGLLVDLLGFFACIVTPRFAVAPKNTPYKVECKAAPLSHPPRGESVIVDRMCVEREQAVDDSDPLALDSDAPA